MSARLLWCICTAWDQDTYVHTYVFVIHFVCTCVRNSVLICPPMQCCHLTYSTVRTYIPDGLHLYLPSVLYNELLQPWLFLMWECCRHAGRGLAGCALLPQSALFDLCSHCFHLPLLLTVQFVHECLAVLVSRGVNSEGVPMHLRMYICMYVHAYVYVNTVDAASYCTVCAYIYVHIHICTFMYCMHCISTC